MLHTFSDKSILQKISAEALILIPVWKGNRFIDLNHANKIKESINGNIESLDSTIFRVVKYKDGDSDQRFIVDGQHRQYVIKKYYEEFQVLPLNFQVLIIEKTVDSEAEAIEYFNIVNNSKPQQDSDPKLLANKYILALETHYKKLIRPEGKTTKRPFLSSDTLRKVLEEHGSILKQSDESVKKFIQKVDEWNKKKMKEYETDHKEKSKKLIESCLEKQFVLAFDSMLPWIKECLN